MMSTEQWEKCLRQAYPRRPEGFWARWRELVEQKHPTPLNQVSREFDEQRRDKDEEAKACAST